MIDMPELPEFLRRSVTAPAPPPAPARKRRPRARRRSETDEFEADLRRIADRRWRQWAPGPGTGLVRPRKASILKQVRAEFARRK